MQHMFYKTYLSIAFAILLSVNMTNQRNNSVLNNKRTSYQTEETAETSIEPEKFNHDESKNLNKSDNKSKNKSENKNVKSVTKESKEKIEVDVITQKERKSSGNILINNSYIHIPTLYFQNFSNRMQTDFQNLFMNSKRDNHTVETNGSNENETNEYSDITYDFDDYLAINDGHLFIDITHMQNGQIYVKTDSLTKAKLMVSTHGNTLYYNFTEQPYEIIPLQYGSGTYVFTLYENVTDTKYRPDGTVVLDINLENENAAFLSPNQYVDYDHSLLNIANQIPGNNKKTIFENIRKYIVKNYSYDYLKSDICTNFLLPNIEECYSKKEGICQDLAALTVSLLREKHIPSKFVIGFADGHYHAWTSTLIDGREVIFDPTAEITGNTFFTYFPERIY